MTHDLREAVVGSALTTDRIRILHDEFYDNLGDHAGGGRFANSGSIDTRFVGGIMLGLTSFDTSLPLQWYEDVHDKTGVWPQMLGFVWCYDEAKVFGEPIPCTFAALVALRWYESLRG